MHITSNIYQFNKNKAQKTILKQHIFTGVKVVLYIIYLLYLYPKIYLFISDKIITHFFYNTLNIEENYSNMNIKYKIVKQPEKCEKNTCYIEPNKRIYLFDHKVLMILEKDLCSSGKMKFSGVLIRHNNNFNINNYQKPIKSFVEINNTIPIYSQDNLCSAFGLINRDLTDCINNKSYVSTAFVNDNKTTWLSFNNIDNENEEYIPSCLGFKYTFLDNNDDHDNSDMNNLIKIMVVFVMSIIELLACSYLFNISIQKIINSLVYVLTTLLIISFIILQIVIVYYLYFFNLLNINSLRIL